MNRQFDWLLHRVKSVALLFVLWAAIAPSAASAQTPTFTFECICDYVTAADNNCDICTSTLQSRLFCGILVRKNGIGYKWIDAPYIVKVQGQTVVLQEIIPNAEQVSINRVGTAFGTMDSLKAAVDCPCGVFNDPLFYATDSTDIAPIYLGDTLSIVGRNLAQVTFDSVGKKWVINVDSIAGGGGGGSGSVTSIGYVAPAAGVAISGTNPVTVSGTWTFSLANDLAALEGLTSTGIGVRTGLDTWVTRTITSGTGIAIGNGNGVAGNPTVTNTAPDLVVTLAGAGINVVTGTYPNFTITGTESDGSPTNEGSLSVLAGGGNDSQISSNTSGSTPVTIAGVNGLLVTESGGTINIAPPTGTDRQTLRYNSSGVLLADSQLQNNGTEVSVGAAPIAGAELYVNGFTRVDGTILTRGTGTATGGTLSPTVRLQNTTPTTGDIWYLHSADNGEFQLWGGNSSETLTIEPDGTILTAYDFGIGFLTGTPTRIIGANAAGIVGEITIGSGLSFSGGTLSTTGGGANYQTFREDNTAVTQRPNANFITTAQISPTLTDDAGSTETEIRLDVIANSIGNAQIRQGIARSVIGVTGNAAANVADIQATAADQVLRATGAGTAIGWGQVATGGITNSAVTYAKIQNAVGNNVVMGNNNGAGTAFEELTAAQLQTLAGYTDGSGVANQIAYWSDANTLTGDAAFTVDGANNQVFIQGGTSGAGNGWLEFSAAAAVAGSVELINASVNASADLAVLFANTRNVGNSGTTTLGLSTGGASASDPRILFNIASTEDLAMGLDNSDADKFKITPNTNTVGGVANAGLTLTMDAVPRLGVNKDAPLHPLDVDGVARAVQFRNTGSTWATANIVFGTGAGTGAVVNSIGGGGNGLQITFTTGTGCVNNGVIFTATYPTPFGTLSYVVHGPGNAAAGDNFLNEQSKFGYNAQTSTEFVMEANGQLTDSRQYSMRYVVSGY
jgi:hypothetical protein